MDQLKGVKGWLDSINIVYYEGTPNLSWNQDVAGFHKDWLVFLAKMDSVGEFKPTESEAPPVSNTTLIIDEIGTITTQPATPTLPDNIKPPSGSTFSFLLYASGKRTYTCTSNLGQGSWTLVGIETYFINLKNTGQSFDPGYQVVYHYSEDTPVSGKNLTWSAITKSDQSFVFGKSIAQSNDTADPDRNLPWELVQSTFNQEGGKLSNITYIVSGTNTIVGYTADYWFYSGGLPKTDDPKTPASTADPTATTTATTTDKPNASNMQITYNNYLIIFNFLMLFVVTTLIIM
ncbi:13700_t:CDS:2 [Entrophospora sp. SA101]|nr:13700_t:CDS:2 [Entrophospora sp. SA101]CAJ0835688.1 20601_t:CDS:2 [Entrophospora sp. SA101]CAJ0838410.1 12605_t:CDS:2 [Entrophospora sp. SA101]